MLINLTVNTDLIHEPWRSFAEKFFQGKCDLLELALMIDERGNPTGSGKISSIQLIQHEVSRAIQNSRQSFEPRIVTQDILQTESKAQEKLNLAMDCVAYSRSGASSKNKAMFATKIKKEIADLDAK